MGIFWKARVKIRFPPDFPCIYAGYLLYYEKLPAFVLLAIPCCCFSQTDSLTKKLDSLQKKTDSVGHQTNVIDPNAYNDYTKITKPVYVKLLYSDLKQQLTAPFSLSGKSWLKAAAFSGIIALGTTVDEPVQQKVITWRDDSKSLRRYSNYITNTGGQYEAITLGAIGIYGWLARKEKVKTVTYLATQAYLTSSVVVGVTKILFGRQRPSIYDPNHIEAEPTFRGPFKSLGTDVNGKKTNGSFPSGHTTLAFAAATVYAKEYRNRPLIPILSYSAATLIGLSRITENKHWTTDVVAGAVLGYFSGRQVVNNYHRFAKIQNAKVKEKKFGFNVNHNQGSLQPGIIWRP